MIRIRKWRPVAAWQWCCSGNTDHKGECGICQAFLEAACPECHLPGDGCPVVVGQCTHLFHSHCIVKWTAAQLEAAATNELAIEPTEPCCPMCRQKWQVQD